MSNGMSYTRNVYMSSHVNKCDFVLNFDKIILYIYLYFVYMLRVPRQMSYHSFTLTSTLKLLINLDLYVMRYIIMHNLLYNINMHSVLKENNLNHNVYSHT